MVLVLLLAYLHCLPPKEMLIIDNDLLTYRVQHLTRVLVRACTRRVHA